MSNAQFLDDRGDELGAGLPVTKVPAHWLMARLGKRVLRPGGVETTRWLLEHAGIGPSDDVVELATGLGTTARAILAARPASYIGVEREAPAAALTENNLAAAGFAGARVIRGDAARVPLADGAASVVFGEALLSMQGATKKRAIFAEARRLLRAGGRYAIHELALAPDELSPATLASIEHDLSRSIHVGVRIGTVAQWRGWLEEAGFEVEQQHRAPMRLLRLDRLLRDEGLLGTARFLFNTATTKGATRRLLDVSSVFRKHERHLCAVALVARAKS
jgi:SAM-dependent methyltransferase